MKIANSSPEPFSKRELSSAGLEHLPYKQRVGGSNPSAPTKSRRLFTSRLFFVLAEGFVQSVAVRVTNLRVAVVCCRKSLSSSDDCL